MEFLRNEVNACNYSKKLNTTCSVEADIIVPDTKPDIYKILSVNAICNPNEHQIKNGKITFDGEMKFNILYISEAEKNKIYNIEYTAPFNHQTEISKASDECINIASCLVTSTDYKVKNSRKLSARGIISIDALVFSYEKVSVIENIEGEASIPFKTKEYKADSNIVTREVEFTISDTISLHSNGGDISIHDFNARIEQADIKTVNNKAIIKMTLPASVFYSSMDNFSVYETEFSVTEIADLDMANSDCLLSYDFNIADIQRELTQADEGASLDIDIKVKGYIRAFEEKTYTLISSMYSPDYSYKLTKADKKIEKLIKLPATQITVKDNLVEQYEDKNITKIHYMNVYPSYKSLECSSSSVNLSGDIQTVIIYTDDSGELCSLKKEVPYSIAIESDGVDDSCIFDVSVKPVNFGYILGSKSEVQARTILKISVDAYSSQELSPIIDFAEDIASPIDKSKQPSIKVCYIESGCTLWDLAEKYNTTCEDIAAVNSLDITEPLKEGKAILIPKRKKI